MTDPILLLWEHAIPIGEVTPPSGGQRAGTRQGAFVGAGVGGGVAAGVALAAVGAAVAGTTVGAVVRVAVVGALVPAAREVAIGLRLGSGDGEAPTCGSDGRGIETIPAATIAPVPRSATATSATSARTSPPRRGACFGARAGSCSVGSREPVGIAGWAVHGRCPR